jgi:hypothetical protein
MPESLIAWDSAGWIIRLASSAVSSPAATFEIVVFFSSMKLLNCRCCLSVLVMMMFWTLVLY